MKISERAGTFIGLILTLAVAFVVLPGCAAFGSANQKIAQDVQDLVTPVEQATLADAQAALVIAQANHDDVAEQCFTDIVNYLQNDPGAGLPAINGLLSGLEATRTFKAPSIPENIHVHCAPLIVDVQRAAIKLGLSLAPIAGGIKVKAGADALKAEAAALQAVKP